MIVDKFVWEVNDLLSDRNIVLKLSETAKLEVIRQGYDSKMGARPMARKINELVKVPLSKRILFENLNNCTVNVDFDTEIKFDVVANQKSMFATNTLVDEDGYVVVE